MKRKERGEENTQEWLNTYADMITLVLTFFVLLYSSAPACPMQSVQSMAASIQQYMEDQDIQVNVTSKENYIYIRFKNDLLFGPDSSVLLDNSRDALNYIGTLLRDDDDEISAVYINGHTAESAGSLVNDRILSSERAANVAIYLEDQVKVDPRKLITRGYGKYYPIADNSTKEGREQNRRVDMIILGKDFQITDMADDDAELFNPVSPFDVPGAINTEQEGEKTSG